MPGAVAEVQVQLEQYSFFQKPGAPITNAELAELGPYTLRSSTAILTFFKYIENYNICHHALYHMWQTAPNNGWGGWASLGGWIDQLTVGQNKG